MSVPGEDDGSITPGGGGTIGGAGDITGVITGGTVNRRGGAGVPGSPGGTGGTGNTGGTGGTDDTGGTSGTGGTTSRRYLMLKSGPNVSGPVAFPASGVAAMIDTRSTSQVTSRVLLDWSDRMTTVTQSRGWFRPLSR